MDLDQLFNMELIDLTALHKAEIRKNIEIVLN